MSTWVIVLLVLLFLVIVGLLIFLYIRYEKKKKELEEQKKTTGGINAILSGVGGGVGNLLGGLTGGDVASLAGIASMLSDVRFKENIQPIAKNNINGLVLNRFNYVGDCQDNKHVGFLAQDVEKKFPDCVKEVCGVKFINYKKLLKKEGFA